MRSFVSKSYQLWFAELNSSLFHSLSNHMPCTFRILYNPNSKIFWAPLQKTATFCSDSYIPFFWTQLYMDEWETNDEFTYPYTEHLPRAQLKWSLAACVPTEKWSGNPTVNQRFPCSGLQLQDIFHAPLPHSCWESHLPATAVPEGNLAQGPDDQTTAGRYTGAGWKEAVERSVFCFTMKPDP